MLFLVVVAAQRRFPLGAIRAWTFGDAQFQNVRDNTQSWEEEDTTECMSYNERYAEARVFCDRECIRENGPIPECAGPWYCSKTVVCQNDNRLRVDKEALQRDCIIVRGCANHSQCFPNDNQAENMRLTPQDFSEDTARNGLRVTFGGITMRTFCCTNKDDYNFNIHQPCNSATSVAGGFLVVVLCSLLLLL